MRHHKDNVLEVKKPYSQQLLIFGKVYSLDKTKKKENPKAVLPNSQDLKAKSFKNVFMPPRGINTQLSKDYLNGGFLLDRNSKNQWTAVRKWIADGIRIHMI